MLVLFVFAMATIVKLLYTPSMFSISMDKRPLEQLENDLDRFGKQALPYAIRNTLNQAAYQTAEEAKENIGRRFIERNQYTRRSVRYKKTFSRRIDQMESAAGSIQPYMAQQESGFTEQKSGKHGVPIPSSAAAGQMGARLRTRKLQRKNWMSAINLPAVRVRGKGRTVAAVRAAVETGQRVVFLDSRSDHFGRPTGLYRVVGGKNGGHGWPKGAKLQMIYSLERSSVRIRPHAWLQPATEKVSKDLGKIYRDALIRQIRLQRSFRNR
jgi:hypothetical protein